LLLVLVIATAPIGEAAAQAPGRAPISARQQTQVPEQGPQARPRARPQGLITTVTLADIGLGNGFRLAGLGGRRDVFLPVPAGRGIPGYRLIYENQSWRLYARQAETAPPATKTGALTRHTE
jgi:hypothetical protein